MFSEHFVFGDVKCCAVRTSVYLVCTGNIECQTSTQRCWWFTISTLIATAGLTNSFNCHRSSATDRDISYLHTWTAYRCMISGMCGVKIHVKDMCRQTTLIGKRIEKNSGLQCWCVNQFCLGRWVHYWKHSNIWYMYLVGKHGSLTTHTHTHT